eukprot:8062694-Pyramimonas_sp.AAC.1
MSERKPFERWQDWPEYVRASLSKQWWATFGGTDHLQQVVIETGCSGTDAPVKALQQLLPGKIDHVTSIDCDSDSENFIMTNMAPTHFFRDIDALPSPTRHL